MMDAADLIEQIKQSTDTYSRHQCRHTLPEGRRCGSPAMRGERFCYYHHQTRKPAADPQRRQARRNCFHIAPPRSRAAIQASIGDVITRIAYNEIDLRRAGLLLYALQIATTNIKDHQASQQPNVQDQTAEPGNPSQDTFDAELFPRPISHEAAIALYEAALAPNPRSGSAEDPEPRPRSHADAQAEPTPVILPDVSACHDSPVMPHFGHRQETSTNPRHRPRKPRRTARETSLYKTPRRSISPDQGANPIDPARPNVSKVSPNCHFIA